MPLCIVPGCVNRSGENYKTQIQKELEKSVRMTFHKLPRNPQRRKLWLDSLNLAEPRQKRPVVCSMHFDECAFDRTSLSCVRLRENAIPRGFDYQAEDYLNDLESVEFVDDDNSLVSRNHQDLLHIGTTHNPKNKESCTRKSFTSRSTSPDRFPCSEPKVRRTFISRSTSVSPERRVDATQADHLQKALENMKRLYRRRIRTLLQKNRRLEMRISIFKELIVSFQKHGAV